MAKARGGELKVVADRHSLRAGWFRPDELGGLALRWPDVRELIEMHRGGAPVLPIGAYTCSPGAEIDVR